MLKLIFITLLISFIYIPTAKSFVIEAVDYLFADNSLLTVIRNNDNLSIYRTSLRNCSDQGIDKLNIPFSKLTIISKLDPSYMIVVDNSSIILYNVIDKKKKVFATPHKNRITDIIQDKTGEYIATNDGTSFMLYKFANDKLILQYKKESVMKIVSMLIDSDKKIVYSADPNGVISQWNFSGRLISVTDLKFSIIKLIDDPVFNKIFIHSKSAIYLVSKDLSKVEIFLKARVESVFYDSRASRVIVKIGGKFKVYDYNSEKYQYELNVSGTKLASINNANILVTYGQNIVYVYDLRYGLNLGSIKFTPYGTLFLPPDSKPAIYNRNIVDLIAENEPRPMLNDKICASFAAAISGVYIAKRDTNIIIPKIPKQSIVDNLSDITIDQVKGIKVPNATKPPKVPDEPTQVADIKGAKKPLLPTDPKNIILPDMQTIQRPRSTTVTNKARLLADSDIPKWIIGRKNLPEFSSVKSGVTDDLAIDAGKVELKNEIVRFVMKKVLAEKTYISKMADGEIKKRLLWTIASNITLNQAHKIKVNDSWTSSNGQHYVYMTFNPDGINSVFDNIYKIEIDKVKKLGEDGYMKLAPNKLNE